MDLAAAAGARATRMSLLWAGWGRGRTRAGVTLCYRTDYYATAGSGPTRQSGALARDSEIAASRRRGVCWEIITLTAADSFYVSPTCLAAYYARSIDELSGRTTG